MDEIREIRSPAFGKIRVLDINGYPWMVGEDVAGALGYTDAYRAIARNVKRKNTLWVFHYKDGERMVAISRPAVFDLAAASNHPKAGAFLQWLIDEIWSKE